VRRKKRYREREQYYSYFDLAIGQRRKRRRETFASFAFSYYFTIILNRVCDAFEVCNLDMMSRDEQCILSSIFMQTIFT